MPYVPGDNWIICDLSGKKILMSRSVKTWDGLRVDPEWWDPKHPQLSVRAVPDHMAVIDGRPRPTNLFIGPQYGTGAFCLISPGGIVWTFYAGEDRELLPVQVQLGTPVTHMDVGRWRFTVDDDGALHVDALASSGLTATVFMSSPLGVNYVLTVDDDGAVFILPYTIPST